MGLCRVAVGRREDVSGVLAAPVLPTMYLVPVHPTYILIHNCHATWGRVGGRGVRCPKGEGGKQREKECSLMDEEVRE